MAPHSSTLAWKIPWMEEPGGLRSMGSLRVGYNWATSLSLFSFMHWRRKWQPTPVFLPGESQGRGMSMGSHRVGHDWSDSSSHPLRPLKPYWISLLFSWASLVAQTVKNLKNLPALQETWVWSLVWEDPLEKGMTTHFSILGWRIPWTEEFQQATVHGVTESRTQLSS